MGDPHLSACEEAANWLSGLSEPSVTMAPRLSKTQHELILLMIHRGLSNNDIAKAAPCTARAVRRIRSTFSRFGTTTVPASRTGPDPIISPVIRDSLCSHVSTEPDMVRREMADFIREKFDEDVSVTTITRALQASGLTWKTMRRVAQQQRPELRHFY